MASGDVVFEATNCLVEKSDLERNTVGGTYAGTTTHVTLNGGTQAVPADTTITDYETSLNGERGAISFAVHGSPKSGSGTFNPPTVLDPTKRYKVQITEV